jgi:uncharacterized glyoxalase superfamily protein PhnB
LRGDSSCCSALEGRSDIAESRQSPFDGVATFRWLAKDGRVVMPLEKTFWSAGFGMLVDRFGVPWLINCEG